MLGSRPKKGMWIAVLVVIMAGIWIYIVRHQHRVAQEKQLAEQQAQLEAMQAELAATNNVAATTETNKVVVLSKADTFKSNMDSWVNHAETKDVAQLRLAHDYEMVVRALVESGFVSHDPAVVDTVSRKIWEIAGDRATAIVLEYTTDGRVIVEENAKKWFKAYNPGALLDRIDEVSSRVDAVEQEAAKAAYIRAKQRLEEKINQQRQRAPQAPAPCPKKDAGKPTASYQGDVQELQDSIELVQKEIANQQEMLTMARANARNNTDDPGQNVCRAARIREREINLQKTYVKLARMTAEMQSISPYPGTEQIVVQVCR